MAAIDFISPSAMGMGMGMSMSMSMSMSDMDTDRDTGIDMYKTGLLGDTDIDLDIFSVNPFDSGFDLASSCPPEPPTTSFDSPQANFAPITNAFQLPDLPPCTADEQLQLWSMVDMDDGSDHLSWGTPSLQQDSSTNGDEDATSPSIKSSTSIEGPTNCLRDASSRSTSISDTQTRVANRKPHPRTTSAIKSSSDPKREPRKRGRKKKTPRNESEQEAIRSRFLERNRVAASKCREKKKKWVDELETRRVEVEMENSRLRKLQDELFAEIGYLREELGRHEACGHDKIEGLAEKRRPSTIGVEWTTCVEDPVPEKTDCLETAEEEEKFVEMAVDDTQHVSEAIHKA
ncbi:uncharacterized protein BP5553_03094 [Venustampulla echinocandica]|uniref:BZIP domain-containing protein n=1 Tax=Venustampulla echinocandica TaxID=2656787 RepID=A0A370TTD0_9HELO|nr:uncharacterized protein BP5553_03094 [Venustampulla echinocandica]RDL38754.1 hypothetical protein BP5553_03094 [Venustampulla echinocandica]